MISAAIERSYPKRLLMAGWWQMGLFQRSVQTCQAGQEFGGVLLGESGLKPTFTFVDYVPRVGWMATFLEFVDSGLARLPGANNSPLNIEIFRSPGGWLCGILIFVR